MNISGVKGREFAQYYENFRPELQPEIQEGFSTRGHPRSLHCFQFPAGCLNICLDLTPISAQPPRKTGGWPEIAVERAKSPPLIEMGKGRGQRRRQRAAGGVRARDRRLRQITSGAGRRRRKLNRPISESFEASLPERCTLRLGIAGRRSGAGAPASDVICNDVTCSAGSSSDKHQAPQKHRRQPIGDGTGTQTLLFLVDT